VRIRVLNPLSGGLGHYTDALVQMLQACEVDVDVVEIPEPIVSGKSRLQWLADYGHAIFQQRHADVDETIATWATVGYLDYPALRLVGGIKSPLIVMHDPEPLVYARGYGNLARRAALAPLIRSRAIVHSEAARRALAETLPVNSRLLPLPMGTPTERTPPSSPIVRVVGQYKPSRDLDVLRTLRREGPEDWAYEIIGRGWPDVEGWSVHDAFLSEADFTAAVITSSVVLIPYRSFFQSDVALRCLELGVPFVGPARTSLEDLVGSDVGWLANSRESWLPAVRAAVATPPLQVHSVAAETRNRAERGWRAWLESHDTS